MRLGLNLAATVCLCFVIGACGDDTQPVGGGNEGGSGGSPATGGGGEGGSAPLAALGQPCSANEECAGGLCLTETGFGWAQGYCSEFCGEGLSECTEGTCLTAGSSSVCILECTEATDCPGVANTCTNLAEEGQPPLEVCLGGCTSNTDCTTTNNCVIEEGQEVGACIPLEQCSGGIDEDGNGLVDCEDPACTADATCASAITAACTAATALESGVEVSGTTEGSATFSTNCSGGGGTPEDLYSFAATGDGYLSVSLTSEADFVLALRSDCEDSSTELFCVDSALDGATESLVLDVTSGTTYSIFVEGYNATQSGDYAISATFITPTAETEPNDTSVLANTGTEGIVTASINPTADADWFRVTLAATGTLSAKTISRGTNVCEAGTLDSYITVYGADGITVVAENDDSNPFGGNYCSTLDIPDLDAGVYYVEVKKSEFAGPDATFDYGVLIGIN